MVVSVMISNPAFSLKGLEGVLGGVMGRTVALRSAERLEFDELTGGREGAAPPPRSLHIAAFGRCPCRRVLETAFGISRMAIAWNVVWQLAWKVPCFEAYGLRSLLDINRIALRLLTKNMDVGNSAS